ncbi:MAG: hypothetical protein JWM03_1060 [Rhodocyclales bacterium]|nr:hypothetical protein [Rhodocyclales bacterium]
MSKMLATLIAGLFAISAFAADAPKTATPETKAPVVAVAKTKAKTHAPAAKAVKTAHKTKKVAKTKPAPTSTASAPAAK